MRFSTYHDPPSGSATWATLVSWAMICCVRKAIRAVFSVGNAMASSIELVCSDCVPPSTPANASIAVRTMLISGCCAVSDTPAVWVWKRNWSERLELRAIAITQPTSPDAPSGAVLGDLLEEIDVGVEEERQSRCERVDRQAGLHRQLDVGKPIGQRERQLFDRGRPRLADVVPGDRDRVPARHLRRGEGDRVANKRIDGRGGNTNSFCA